MEEKMAVLAHEFQHLKDRHQLNTASVLVAAVYLFSMLNITPFSLSLLAVFSFATLCLIPISWILEKKADSAAKRYAGEEVMKPALLKLAEGGSLNTFTESHPSTKLRIKWLEKEEKDEI